MTELNIGVVSDLHAEFWSPAQRVILTAKIQQALAAADLILLAGDIDNGTDAIRTARHIFPTQPVCLVAGNHEFYSRDYRAALGALIATAARYDVALLQQTTHHVTLKGRPVRVLGATLWTDFALFGTVALSMLDASLGLSDYRVIQNGERRLTPADTLAMHQADKAWLLAELDQPFDGTTIVMTHHAPVSFATPPKFLNDPLPPAFASRLEMHLVRPDVALVVWGHTHHPVDRTIDATRFVSEQTGYLTGPNTVETGRFGTIITL